MIVLVIDDQTSVVNGIVSGVRWHKVGVSKILTAYNAFEAKEIMSKQQVDLLLCDIEMPAENGLSLLRWAREKGYEVECIFLTAHADFYYTTEAIRLGGFDYILQPARYDDIEAAIAKAFRKQKKEEEQKKYSTYGEFLYHRKSKVIETVLKDWYVGKESLPGEIWKDLEMFHVKIESKSKIHVALLYVTGWKQGEDAWEEGLIRFSLANVTKELFERFGQDILFTQIDKSCFCVLLYERNGYLVDREGVMRQLQTLQEFCESRLGMEMASYLGDAIEAEEVRNRIQELQQMEKDNVGHSSGIFSLGEQLEQTEHNFEDEMNRWAHYLENENTERVKEESCGCLEHLFKNGKMNAEQLKRFYFAYIQIVCSAANNKGIFIKDMFANGEELEESIKSSQSIKGMKSFICFTMDFLEKQFRKERSTDEKNIVNEVKEYIQNNLEKDIRRNELAESLYFSQDYISRCFKKETGMTLKDYIIDAKMREAKLLLQSTILPISMIATKVGYTNFSHFSQIYKKSYGITPTEERETKN